MAPIRIGFVGLSEQGWASWVLVPSLLKAPLSSSYSLTALSTTKQASADASAEKYSKQTNSPVKAYYGTTSAISRDPNVDLVAVVVKAPAHREAAIPVLEAGKDLFIEWPVGRNLQETLEIAKLAKAKGVRTIVGFQGRQGLLLNKVKSIIDSGEIGRVMSSTATGRPYRELFAWGPFISEHGPYTADAENGATLLDIAVGHFLDSFTYVLGNFSTLSATVEAQYPTAELVDATGKPTGKTVEQTGPSQVAIAGKLQSGAVVSLHWRGGLESKSGKAGTPFIWIIDGEKGSIRLESDEAAGSFIQIHEPKVYLNGEEVTVESDNMDNTARAWAEFAKGKEGKYATVDDAVKVKSIVDAIKRSARDGAAVKL